MLMQAFERFAKKYPESYLIIIGGYGTLYNETLRYAEDSLSNIVIIKSMSNPIAVMKKCDLFILSSYYEGLGLTLLEADTIGMTVVVNGDEQILDQIEKQVRKLVDVADVKTLKPGDSVNRELIMVKLRADAKDRQGINAICDIFRPLNQLP